MPLDTSTLRTIDEPFPPIKDRIITLLCIGGGKVVQASTVTEKRELIVRPDSDMTFIAVWTGQWRSDAFQVTKETLTRWRKELRG